PGAPAASPAAAAAGDLGAGDRPPLQPDLPAQLRRRHRLLSARLLHDEAQPASERADSGPARPRPPAPGPAARPRPGRARAYVAAAGRARRDHRPAPREPAAFGRLPRRARRAAAYPRLPRGPRRTAPPGARPR